MIVHTYGHTRTYEMEALLKLFVPAQKFAFSTEETLPEEDFISAVITPCGDGMVQLVCRTRLHGDLRESSSRFADTVQGNALDRELSILLYPQLCALTGMRPAWGMLTGIRPVTLLRRTADRLGGLAQAQAEFRDVWQVREDKIRLATEILQAQQPIFAATPKHSVSVYISIPFCPTRCRYCSFVSNSVAQMQKLIPEYYKCLHTEMQIVGELIDKCGLTVDTVYIGGGTPTTIDLFQPLDWIDRYLRPNNRVLREFTVEAGRPDTITRTNLSHLLQFGVTRISVNPQSFQDDVLKAAGRPHTAQDAVEKYLLAKELGFTNVNMDLIAGLPCDTVKGFCESIDRAVALDPESITVHCLALKKAADFYQTLPMPDGEAVAQMVEYAQRTLCAAGYRPYYLYRQKNMAANLENVGYAKPGFESPYNILMMDDSQTILGIGSGASTKLIGGQRGVERLTECKYPYEYLDRFDSLMEQKRALAEALSQIKA